MTTYMSYFLPNSSLTNFQYLFTIQKFKKGDRIALKFGSIYASENPLDHTNLFEIGFCSSDLIKNFKQKTLADTIFGVFAIETKLDIIFNKNSTKFIDLCTGNINFTLLNKFMGVSDKLLSDMHIGGSKVRGVLAKRIEEGVIHVATKLNIEIYINKNEIVDVKVEHLHLFPVDDFLKDITFKYQVTFKNTNLKPKKNYDQVIFSINLK